MNVENSIDQYFYEEDGKYYMLWGSFFGIYIMELDVTDDVMITPKLDTKRLIAGNAYEGINLWKRDGYYYLIGSIGSCCEGQKSTYTTVVARSKDLFGPYVDKQGGQMLDNKHEVILHKNDRFVGTGHNSTLLEDDEKNTWMLYHAFELERLDAQRQVLLDRILWDEDGLALSSRNARLSAVEREYALNISQTLFKSCTFAKSHPVAETQKFVEDAIAAAPGLRLEYFEIVDGTTLQKITDWEDTDYAVGCITVFCGEVRLIDNIKYKG